MLIGTVPNMPVADLALLDDHDIVVDASADAVWAAVVGLVEHVSSGTGGRLLARLLGCRPDRSSGWDEPGVGTTVPGFAMTEVERPDRLVVEGHHHFSRYGIAFHLEPVDDRQTRCRLESRADFPGPHGRLYRFGLLATGAHVAAVRRMLRTIASTAERA